MPGKARFSWGRIVLAVIAAEALPILLLVLVVVVYNFTRQADSPPPEAFAPKAGTWVGPLGGFVATMLFARWVAGRAAGRKLAHGAAVGAGTAVLDIGLALLLGGSGAVEPVFFLSNAGRLMAGVLGGWLGARRGSPAPAAGAARHGRPV